MSSIKLILAKNLFKIRGDDIGNNLARWYIFKDCSWRVQPKKFFFSFKNRRAIGLVEKFFIMLIYGSIHENIRSILNVSHFKFNFKRVTTLCYNYWKSQSQTNNSKRTWDKHLRVFSVKITKSKIIILSIIKCIKKRLLETNYCTIFTSTFFIKTRIWGISRNILLFRSPRYSLFYATWNL